MSHVLSQQLYNLSQVTSHSVCHHDSTYLENLESFSSSKLLQETSV